MKFEVRNVDGEIKFGSEMERKVIYNIYTINGELMFTAKIDCAEDAPRAQKLRQAVFWAINNYVSLQYADA